MNTHIFHIHVRWGTWERKKVVMHENQYVMIIQIDI
jgi:hypothetical protein